VLDPEVSFSIKDAIGQPREQADAVQEYVVEAA
jgi:hypothetical protein